MRPLAKVTGQDKFELLYKIRKREQEGWKRGKICEETKRVKQYKRNGKYIEYAGDSITQQYVCYMTKEDER